MANPEWPVWASIALVAGMVALMVAFLIRQQVQVRSGRDEVLDRLRELLVAEGNALRAVGRWKGREVVIERFGEPRVQVACAVRDVRIREIALASTRRANRGRLDDALPILGDLQTGDAVFDARFDVQGTLLPWISGPVLERVRAVPYGLAIDDGRVSLPVEGLALARLEPALDALVALAVALDAHDVGLDQRALDAGLPVAQRVAALMQLANGDLDAALAVAMRFCDEADPHLRVHGLEVLSRVDAVDALGVDALRGYLTLDDDTAQEAAVEALGRVGTLDDVPRLQALGASEIRLGRATRDALTAIQGRVGGRRGEVALAGAEGGELSLTEPVGERGPEV